VGWRSRGDRPTVGCESSGAIGSSRSTVWGESRSGRLKNAIGNYFERIVVFVRM
jgi:hypothetical protein